MGTIIGIDLGTTNSEVAALVDNQVRILGAQYRKMLPSCVGLSPDGRLLVGEPAKNQHLLYPERTVLAVKRQMGLDEKLSLGDQSLSPQEVSALILKELAKWAAAALGEPPSRTVITVPAYFSDAQRQATREAGALAGLEVVRIINEPTAASLAYNKSGSAGDVLVYDLGGGTFDVSVVRSEAGVTEVLASHGNNRLGGDDFTERLFDHLARAFTEAHGIDILKDHPQARSRLWWASEAAKVTLSTDPFAKIMEENLVMRDGKPYHLTLEITRHEYESLIRPLVASTMESVTKALTDAGITSSDLKEILLVGGATRTPLVQEMLRERSKAPLHQEVHPDLCVALGAGILGAQLAGNDVDQALVDITAYSFGISYLDTRGYAEYPYCYKPIIHRNSALPITRTERYFTAIPGQPAAKIEIFQGEDSDALKNIPLGEFLIEGLQPTEKPNEILCRMHIDLDGILQVSAIEKATDRQKKITIENALRPMSEAEIQEARGRLQKLFQTASDLDDGEAPQGEAPAEEEAGPTVIPIRAGDRADWGAMVVDANKLVARSRELLGGMHPDDQEDAVDLHERIETAIQEKQSAQLEEAVAELKEIVFFIAGK
jgi:molecular chaperone DnaK (HSP70)